jgi:integrase
MGLFRRPDSKVWWISYMVAGRQRRESSHSMNKRVAKNLLAIRQAQVLEGRLQLPKSKPPRFEDWSEQFLREEAPHQSTKERYRYSVQQLLVHFKGARLSEITPENIEEFKHARLDGGVMAATVNRDLAALRRMLNLAKRRRLIGQNPFAEVEFLEERKHRRQPHILTFEEEARLLAVAPPRIRVLVILVTETGLRIRKEALQLRWEDVDLINGVIHVRESKTPAGRRSVPLSALCKAELLGWRDLVGPEVSVFVFPSFQNTRHPLQGGRKNWAAALKKAGIDYFPIYNLRATFASRLSAAGCPDTFVAQMLGHSTPSILQTYSKVLDEYRRDAIRKLEAYRQSFNHPVEAATVTSRPIA